MITCEDFRLSFAIRTTSFFSCPQYQSPDLHSSLVTSIVMKEDSYLSIRFQISRWMILKQMIPDRLSMHSEYLKRPDLTECEQASDIVAYLEVLLILERRSRFTNTTTAYWIRKFGKLVNHNIGQPHHQRSL